LFAFEAIDDQPAANIDEAVRLRRRRLEGVAQIQFTEQLQLVAGEFFGAKHIG